MDSYEATNVVLTKIKNLDPENASKIMGFLLISLEESELVRLSCSPDHVLHALILRAKAHLGISSNTSLSTSATPSPSPLNPIARPTTSNPFSQSSPRIGDNGFDFSRNPSSPSSHSWTLSGFPNNPISPNSSHLLSYKNIRAGFPNGPAGTVKDFIDEHQVNDYFSFLNESSTSNEELVDPRVQLGHGVNNWHSVSNGDVVPFHRRSFSASDACFESEEVVSGIGYKPCLYFARGHCKNGNNCKFVHGVLPDSLDASAVGSPSRYEWLEQLEEVMRLKSSQQRMMSTSRLASTSSIDQYINFLMQQPNDPQSQRGATAAAFMMGEEFFNFGRVRPERNDFSAMLSAEKLNSASRQIYLTFPAESTFKDEDVSEYFSKFGPVQDVRIPYQQKRMFGFVTFVHPETVRLILSKGNPHFICDSRVLVKPYKEKGKAPDKRQQHQQQQFDRGDFSPSLSPMGFDSKEPYDLHLGARMFYNPQEIFFRRQLEEQAEQQKAIELEERRLMNLQLPDFKNNPIHHHQRSLSVGSPLTLPQLHSPISNTVLSPDSIKRDITGYSGYQASTISLPTATSPAEKQEPQQEVNPACIHDNAVGNKKDSTNADNNLEQVLPNSLSALPTKAADLSNLSALSEVNESAAFSTSPSTHSNLELPTTSSNISPS